MIPYFMSLQMVMERKLSVGVWNSSHYMAHWEVLDALADEENQ
jgi:hypothetical protein